MKNLLTDIAGVRVGHASDARLASGVTAVMMIAAMDPIWTPTLVSPIGLLNDVSLLAKGTARATRVRYRVLKNSINDLMTEQDFDQVASLVTKHITLPSPYV
jgi:hypothetical protein